MLFQKGDAGDALFGVRRGQVRIETGASDGSRLTLNSWARAICSAKSRC